MATSYLRRRAQRATGTFAAVLYFIAACGTPDRARPELTLPLARARSDAPAERIAKAAAVPALPRRALELFDHGQALEAVDLLARELAQRAVTAAWNDESLSAESVVAALALEDLLERTSAWRAAVAELERARPFPPQTPGELAAQLDLVLARGYLRLDRDDEARALARERGVLTDWRIMGPFANERSGGFDTAYPPEAGVDLAASVRGKERDVAWRENPAADHPLGNVLLDEMLRPNTQAVAYLATALRVARPREILLHVGSTGALKVWNDGELVLSRKVERRFHRDQDRVVLALQPGWNRLLVKVGVEDGPWYITARASEIDGSSISDLEVDASAAGRGTGTVAASAADDASAAGDLKRADDVIARPARATSTLPRSAREVLEARPDDAEAARLLALWHLYVHADDESERTARAHAERAVQQEPNDVLSQYLLARASAPAPRASSEEIRAHERLIPLKAVLALDPAHVGALLDLAEFSMNENPLPARADELTARALAAAPRSWRALKTRAAFLETRGRSAEARKLREAGAATKEGQLAPDGALDRARSARERGALEEELAILAGALTGGSGELPIVEALIDARLARDDPNGASRTLEAWLRRAPFDVKRMLELARALEYAEETDGARALASRALAIAPEEPQVHFTLSRLAQRAGDVALADRELAEVVRFDPGYDKGRRQRDVLAQGSEARFEDPYRWDALERIGAVQRSGEANEAVQVVDRTSVWRVEKDGAERSYEHVLLQIENQGGVKQLDRYWIAYPTDGSLTVYQVRVIRPDRTFERAPAPTGGDHDYGENRVRVFDLPPIAVGDCVDVEYRVDPTEPDVFGQYFGARHEFYIDSPDPLAPVHRAELVVIAPKDVPLQARERNGDALERSVEESGDLVVRRWVARDLTRPAMQTAMPARSELAPGVDISTFASWDEFASWWWNFIEKEFVTTPEMKAKVGELVTGLSNEREKVRAVARFVGQEIRYNSWPFGTHGYEPFSAPTIFERRFGDCKDKSILLRQMLAEIGVEAHPVLLEAQFRRSHEDLAVAMVGQFNHCIAYLPPTAEREGYYLDATADRNPVEYVRADDQGARALHVRDGKGEIRDIPYAPPEANVLSREYEVEVDRSGDAAVKVVDTSTGNFGVRLRYELGGEKGDLSKRVAETWKRAFGQVDVRAAETSDLEDIGAPVRVEAELGAKRVASREAGRWQLRPSFDDLGILDVAMETPAERAFDLVLDRPFEVRTKVLYRLPEGARVVELPSLATVSAPGLVDYRIDVRESAQGIEVERTFTLHARRIERERYGDFRDALREIRLLEDRRILVEDPVVPELKKEDK